MHFLYTYIHKYKMYYHISYNVLKNIPIYNFKKIVIHLLFCKMLPFTKNILQKDPSFFCPPADGCPPFSKVLERKKHKSLFSICLLFSSLTRKAFFPVALQNFYGNIFPIQFFLRHLPLKYVVYHTEMDFRPI